MKKLLILGGYTHMIDVVRTAKRMGLYTVVVDRDLHSPAKAYADKSFDISTDQIDKLVQIALEEKIDGVMNAFDDFNTWQAQALCEKLDLPYYATKEQLAICSNKESFKAFCRSYQVPVIDEYGIDDLLKEGIVTKSHFPVIVKPVDSYASQGITVCYDQKELQTAYLKAQKRSKSGKVIIERFVDNSHGVEMYYTVKSGKVILTAVTDRYVHKLGEDHPPLPTATIFPSQHQDQFVKTLDTDIRKMIRGMGIENGVLFFQSLFEKGNFHLYEMGFRLSGEQHYQIIAKQTGINLLEMMISFAIGETLDAYPIEKYDYKCMKYPACNLSVLLNEGNIQQIIGLEHIKEMPQVLSFIQLMDVGDIVEATGNYGQMLGRFNIIGKNQAELQKIIQEVNNALKVLSSEGKEMMAAKFTFSKEEVRNDILLNNTSGHFSNGTTSETEKILHKELLSCN